MPGNSIWLSCLQDTPERARVQLDGKGLGKHEWVGRLSIGL